MLIIIIACALMAAASLYFIISPFFKQKKATSIVTSESFDMESVYEAVNELEMDVLMNKISPEEFSGLKETYYRLAAAALEQKDSEDEDILKALAEIRQAKSRASN